jgi:hypothetical protein
MGKENVEIVNGPVMPGMGDIMYHVTLSSGMIVTRPYGFGPDPEPARAHQVVVSSAGQVLAGKPVSTVRVRSKRPAKAVALPRTRPR